MGIIVYPKRDYATTGKIAYPSRRQTLFLSTNDLIVYWKLEESSGNRLPSVGTIQLIPVGVSQGGGISGNCVEFTNTGQYLYSNSAVASNSQFTFALWIYPTVATTIDVFDHRRGSLTDFATYCLSDLKSRIYHWKSNGSATEYASSNPMILNQWNFVAFSGDFNTTSSYAFWNVNGTLTEFTPANLNGKAISTLIDVGQYQDGARRNFQGKMDEISYWHRALSFEETEIIRTNIVINYA